MSDADNCGGCSNKREGATCSDGQVCIDGACAADVECNTNADCDSGEVCKTDTNTCVGCLVDDNCSDNSFCDGDSYECSCIANYSDCDGDKTNGCEVNISNDSNNCGGCGVQCYGSDICLEGMCTADVECNTNADCDNGMVCETNSNTCVACVDNSDCGTDEICDSNNECKSNPVNMKCNTVADCGGDRKYICQSGVCKDATKGCQSNSDCVVWSGCCKCSGNNIAISEEYWGAYNKEYFVDCSGVSCPMVMCENIATCNSDGYCELQRNSFGVELQSTEERSQANHFVSKVNAQGNYTDNYIYEEVVSTVDIIDSVVASFTADLFEIIASTQADPLDYYFNEMVGESYQVFACGCIDDGAGNCDCVTDYKDFTLNTIEDAYLTMEDLGKNFENFCSQDGYTIICPQEGSTNRHFFKIEWENIDTGEVTVRYADLRPMSNDFDAHLAEESSYYVSGYVCHDVGSDVPFNTCEETPIFSDYLVNTPNCDDQDIDLGLSFVEDDNVVFNSPEEVELNIDFSSSNVSSIDDIEGTVNLELEIVSEENPGLNYSDTRTFGDEALQRYFIDNEIMTVYVPSAYVSYVVDGAYFVYARFLNYSDSEASNNEDDIRVIISDEGCDIVCDGEKEILLVDDNGRCYCFEADCADDSHCGPAEICYETDNPVNNRCVCDNSLCPSNKEMNFNCSACVCKESCLSGQVQDPETCTCYDVCDTVCDPNNREILNEDCECETVECIYDSHCGGREVCSFPSLTCSCPSCGAGLVSNSSCTACVCANSCASGQIQRSDCSCYTPSSDEEDDEEGDSDSDNAEGKGGGTYIYNYYTEEGEPNEQESPLSDENVELEIIEPTDGSTYELNGKETFKYKLGENGDVEFDEVKWYVDGNLVGTGNFVTYTFDSSGDKEIALEYKDEEMDSVDVRVLKEDESGGQEVGEEDTERSMGIFTYFLIGIGVVILLGFIILLLGSKMAA
jgi:hypothetical protein